MFWLSLPVLKPDVCAADTDMVHLAGLLVSIAEPTTSTPACEKRGGEHLEVIAAVIWYKIGEKRGALGSLDF